MRERASLMVLIVPIALGLIMYVFHVRRSPLEVMRMPYFVVVAAVGMAIGCAATEMVGFVLASAVLLVGIINAGLPAWAMWTAQAPVDKQARLNSVQSQRPTRHGNRLEGILTCWILQQQSGRKAGLARVRAIERELKRARRGDRSQHARS